MKCARCHRHIPKGEEMIEKIGGRLVPTHRDCGINYATPPPRWSLDSMISHAFRNGPSQDLKRKNKK